MSQGATGLTAKTAATENEYAELKRRIKDAGLLEREYGYYAMKIAVTLALLAFSISLFFLVDNYWLVLAFNAPFLAFVFGQVGFMSHDTGHRQVFSTVKWNEFVGVITSYILGLSRSWWVEKHNAHHANPNQEDMDPDIEIPVLAFSPQQALGKKGVFRFIVKRQAKLFLPVLLLQAFGLRLASAQYLMRNKPRYPVLEPVGMVLFPIVYLGILLATMSWWQALLFFLVNQALFGLYLASVFAPNHKGMLILEKDSDMDFLRRQVLTARNVRAHPFVDFWYGGLNYQIEHHLFPSMPRNNLGKAQKIVKEFCAEYGISYYETGMFRSYKEIVEFLHVVSAPLRQKSAQGASA
jgi:fatty acid desaturase